MSSTAANDAETGLAPGHDRVSSFGDIAHEYAALKDGAALVDRSARLRILFRGDKAAETLTGLVTNDVLALQPGDGQLAAALTAKGKVIADVRIFARDKEWLVDCAHPATDGFRTMVRKYVNPRLARYDDQSAALRDIGVFGPLANALVARVLGIAGRVVDELQPYQHVSRDWQGSTVQLTSAHDLGVKGFDLFVDEPQAAALWRNLADAGALPAGTSAANIARVEAGFPLWGIDMDDNTLAQEANLDVLGAISYSKGCYTGQETVARVHFRGHVNRTLRGIEGGSAMPQGAALFDNEGAPIGDVRSSVVSPRLGPIAIAMLRRSVESGSEIQVRWDHGECRARVRELPVARLRPD